MILIFRLNQLQVDYLDRKLLNKKPQNQHRHRVCLEVVLNLHKHQLELAYLEELSLQMLLQQVDYLEERQSQQNLQLVEIYSEELNLQHLQLVEIFLEAHQSLLKLIQHQILKVDYLERTVHLDHQIKHHLLVVFLVNLRKTHYKKPPNQHRPLICLEVLVNQYKLPLERCLVVLELRKNLMINNQRQLDYLVNQISLKHLNLIFLNQFLELLGHNQLFP